MKKILICLSLLWMNSSLWAGNFKSISWIHSKEFNEDELEAQLELEPGFDTLKYVSQKNNINYGIETLKNLCEVKGYLSCKVSYTEPELGRFKIELKEGPKFQVSALWLKVMDSTITHLTDTAGLGHAIHFIGNQNYHPDQRINYLQEVIHFLDQQGYIHNEVQQSMLIDSLNAKVELVYQIKLNRRVLMGDLKLSISRIGKDSLLGLTRTQSLADLWRIPREQPIRSEDLFAYRRKLMQTGLFYRIDLKDSVNGALSDLYVKCIERAPGSLSSKLYYNYEQVHDFGINLNATHKNVAGQFHQVGTELNLGLREQKYGLSYSQPLFLGLPLRFEMRPFYQRSVLYEPIDEYDYRRYMMGNRFSLSQKHFEHWSWGISSDLGYRVVRFPRNIPGVEVPEDQKIFQIRFDPTVQMDFVNEPTDPTLGIRNKWQYSNGGGFDSDNRFSGARSETHLYLPMGKGLNWAGVFEIGALFQGADLLEAKSYFQGGFRTVRGYTPFSIQPHFTPHTDAQGKATEAMQYSKAPYFWRMGHELRLDFPNQPNMIMALFFDYTRIKDLRNPRLTEAVAAAVGPGLRWKISMLSLRIDYAWWKNFDDFSLYEDFSFGRLSIDLSQAI